MAYRVALGLDEADPEANDVPHDAQLRRGAALRHLRLDLFGNAPRLGEVLDLPRLFVRLEALADEIHEAVELPQCGLYFLKVWDVQVEQPFQIRTAFCDLAQA